MRPTTLKQIIGQAPHKELIQRQLTACQRSKEAFPHTLFFGPPGVGKTTLAQVIAHEMAAEFVELRPDLLRQASHVWDRIIVPMAQADEAEREIVVFIDEIHGLSLAVTELLYPMLEDGTFIHEKKGRFVLPSFTLIGATTYPGMLSGPLLDRFGLKLALDPYDEDDIFDIIARHLFAEMQQYGLTIPPIEEENVTHELLHAAQAILARCRLTPRIAIEMTRGVVRTAAGRPDNSTNLLTAADAEDYFRMMRIDAYGLTPTDRQYLTVLARHLHERPAMGIRQLADLMRQSADYLEQHVEPYLMDLGFIARTRSGRSLTAEGRAYLRQQDAEEDQSSLQTAIKTAKDILRS